jgi:SAM-dependent methyltransferase
VRVSTPVRREVTPAQARQASRRWWDSDAAAYTDEHGDFLGASEFTWCPEGLREPAAGLLGDVRGLRVLEIGCGAGQCTRWLASQGARAVGLDLSLEMMRVGRDLAPQRPALVNADAGELPFPDGAFDLACSAFGAVPFVADSGQLMREVHRVLRPGSPWIFSVTHPIRWCFPDDPGPDGLSVVHSYFDRRAYTESDGQGLSYVEQHRTVGDRLRELVSAGFAVEDLVEPEWVPGVSQDWGQWSGLRGGLFPGTSIWVTRSAQR